MALVAAHELARSFDCSTPGCAGGARSRSGPGAYCQECQEARRPKPPAISSDRLGLTITGELSFTDWRKVLRHVMRTVDAAAWVVGDALTYGQFKYATKIRFALDELGLSRGQYMHWTYVASNVPRHVRREDLSWSHHYVVARLDDERQQRAWLARAAAEGWTVDELRSQMDDARRRTSKHSSTSVVTDVSTSTRESAKLEHVRLNVAAPPERVVRWREAAAARGLTLSQLAGDALESRYG